MPVVLSHTRRLTEPLSSPRPIRDFLLLAPCIHLSFSQPCAERTLFLDDCAKRSVGKQPAPEVVLSHTDLAAKIALLDGILPAATIIDRLAKCDLEHKRARKWRSVAIGALVVSLVVVGASTTTVSIYARSASEMRGAMAAFDFTCVDRRSLAQVVQLAERTADINLRCVALHEHNKEFFETVIRSTPSLKSVDLKSMSGRESTILTTTTR